MGVLFTCFVGALSGCGGADETRPAKWSYISTAIVQPNCATANCHSDLSQRSGVKLDDMHTGWEQLVCRNFVIAGNPSPGVPLNSRSPTRRSETTVRIVCAMRGL